MKSALFPKIFLVLILIWVGAFDWIEYLTVAALRAAAAASIHEHADLLKKIEKAKQDGAALLAKRLAPKEKKSDPATTKSIPVKVADTTKATALPDWASSADARKLLAIVLQGEMEAQIDGKYGPLFKTLGLSAEQSDQIKALLLEREQAAREAFDAVREQKGLTLKDAWSEGVILNAIDPVNSKIQQMLNGTDFADFQQYDQTLGVQNTINKLAELLNANNMPLTPVQAQAVKQFMIGLETPEQLQNQMRMNSVTTLDAPITTKDIQAAAAILSPAQMDTMNQLRQRSMQNRELNRLLR